ncbi:rhodanese domain protein [Roseobacter sp. SK209-2-6]|uniref:rhodanese-like domain-containing protein n=1 Tax=Roseobacter sp. SK209-2-6 TaxID=388739 RepID=UPI0000F3EEFB|nr:rhodanese-like domain-containing protein [Roseobacter sp. SK209-2-6]EBA16698.1 rhodanese domain protein [Roseobacter sp. SK209-2-6]
MTNTSPRNLREALSEAEARVPQISVRDARALLSNEHVLFIDLRDIREIERFGGIKNAHCCARGLLEFALDPESPYFREVFSQYETFIFYCDNGMRSLLAAQTAQDFGLGQVFALEGGLERWMELGHRSEPLRWTPDAA